MSAPETPPDPTPDPPRPVTVPADGIPPVVDTPDALARTIDRLTAGTGPVALDTERAHGFRYWPKAYLIQVRRAGSGTHLIDPVAFEAGAPRADLSALRAAIADEEWILHAATQDLPSLAEVGLLPERLFDTELAGRLLGLPRVALGALLERALGVSLAKEHSASDWSTRPLPEAWLAYAALDVELLVELRDWIEAELEAAGKLAWAEQEFAHLVAHAGDEPHRRAEPWRRCSGLHAVRTPRGLAAVRELWTARDTLAQELDRAPGRILGDSSITDAGLAVDAAKSAALGRDTLRRIHGFTWRLAKRYESRWLDALSRADALSAAELPPRRAASGDLPQPRSWARANPEAAARWERIRPAVNALAEQQGLPPENLLSPDALRRLAWAPPADVSEAGVDAALAALDARPWQRGLVVPVVAPLLSDA
ncbi:ribonuclease D [Propioniciclava soli]|uniref:Ribonuclease D n=1 Tax=Propioniciclava soli TaxID=2775081 RepID=A0ABZ3CBG1_9ACTN